MSGLTVSGDARVLYSHGNWLQALDSPARQGLSQLQYSTLALFQGSQLPDKQSFGPLKHVDSRTTQYPEGTVGSSQSVGSHGTVPKSFPECGIIKASLPSLSQYVDHTGQSPGTSESVTGPWHLGIPFLKLSTCYSMLGLGCGSYVPSLACRGDPSYVPRYCGAQ